MTTTQTTIHMPPTAPAARRWTLVGVQAGLLLAVLLAGMAYRHLGGQPQGWFYPLCVVTILLSGWLIWSWRHINGTSFDPYLLFLLGSILFNGGQVLLEIFQLNTQGILLGRFSPELNLQTVYLVCLGQMAFHLGALYVAARYRPVGTNESPRWYTDAQLREALVTIGLVLLVVSLPPMLLLMRERIATVLSGGYIALYMGDKATGMSAAPRILASFLIPASLFLLAGSPGRRGYRHLATATMLIYVIVQFMLGNRAWGVMPLVGYAWVWHRCVRPLPKGWVLAGGLALLLVIFPAVKMVRSLTGEARTEVLLGGSFVRDNPVVAIFSEMGGSMRTVAETIRLVPDSRPFDKGASYGYGLLTIFPNLFWDVHPSVAHGSASDWLVEIVEPVIASLGGGIGYSYIGEAYLNFGWYGAPAVLLLIGALYAWLVLWASRSSDPARIAMVASFVAFFLFFARGESAAVIRPLVWYALIPYLLVLLRLRQLRWRARAATGRQLA